MNQSRKRPIIQLRLLALLLFPLASQAQFKPGLPIGMPHQFPPQIKRIVVIFQENRTPDNLFHFLTPACPLPATPADAAHACTPAAVNAGCYDISPCGISRQQGTPVPITLTPLQLTNSINPDHSHLAFDSMCDPDPNTFACRMDGAWRTTTPKGGAYAYADSPAVTNSDGSAGHLLDPYITLAKRFGWANAMFQTNQGASYPAHQFIFGGTSAQTAEDDQNSTFISDNFKGFSVYEGAGCLAPAGAGNMIISPALSTPPVGCRVYAKGSVQECPIKNDKLVYPTDPVGTFCYPHQSIADLLDRKSITWKYYAPSPGSIWTAPDSIKSICQPKWIDPNNQPASGLECSGDEWNTHVDTANLGTNVLRDIANCDLNTVNWVIPNGAWSDHAGTGNRYGPSWVAAVVNAIGNNPKCPSGTQDAGQSYWENTAIVITWDDWGGWSDHVPPVTSTKLPCLSLDCQADYQLGFRVPLIVVSAYTPPGYINNAQHDFGSVLRMIEGVNHLPEGALGFADKRSSTDLLDFFSLRIPRPYQNIPAEKNASFFLTFAGPATDPDDD